MCTVLPETEQTPSVVDPYEVMGRFEVAVALTVKSAAPTFFVVGVPAAKVIVWLA